MEQRMAKRLSKLRSLKINGCRVETNRGFGYLQGLAQLQSLDLCAGDDHLVCWHFSLEVV